MILDVALAVLGALLVAYGLLCLFRPERFAKLLGSRNPYDFPYSSSGRLKVTGVLWIALGALVALAKGAAVIAAVLK